MARAASTVCSLCEGVGTQRAMVRDGSGGWKHKPGECKAQGEVPVKDADEHAVRRLSVEIAALQTTVLRQQEAIEAIARAVEVSAVQESGGR